MANFSKQGSKKFESQIRRTFFSAGIKRRWMQYMHLRRLLTESKGALMQLKQNARFLGIKGDFRINHTFHQQIVKMSNSPHFYGSKKFEYCEFSKQGSKKFEC